MQRKIFAIKYRVRAREAMVETRRSGARSWMRESGWKLLPGWIAVSLKSVEDGCEEGRGTRSRNDVGNVVASQNCARIPKRRERERERRGNDAAGVAASRKNNTQKLPPNLNRARPQLEIHRA